MLSFKELLVFAHPMCIRFDYFALSEDNLSYRTLLEMVSMKSSLHSSYHGSHIIEYEIDHITILIY